VPALVKVNEYDWPCANGDELKFVDFIWWFTASMLVHVTVVPTETVSGLGEKEKFWIVTAAAAGCVGLLAGTGVGGTLVCGELGCVCVWVAGVSATPVCGFAGIDVDGPGADTVELIIQYTIPKTTATITKTRIMMFIVFIF